MFSPLLPEPTLSDNCLTAIHLLTTRGEALASAVYRPAEALPEACDAFFQRWRAEKPPPCFPHRAVHFAWVELPTALLMFAYSRTPFSPSFILEALLQMAAVLDDFLGGLAESAVRRNPHLVQELLDEMVDDGYIQNTDPQLLRSCVALEPIAPKFTRPSPEGEWRGDTDAGPCAAHRQSIADRHLLTTAGRCDVCIDVAETLSVTVLPDGQPYQPVVLGQVTVRALFARSPPLALQLNPSITLCTPSSGPHGSTAILFAAHSLHPAVSREEWEQSRALHLSPPLGTSVPLRYRVTERIRLPFHVTAVAERTSSDTIEVLIRLQPRLSEQALPCRVTLELPLPLNATSATSSVEMDTKGSDTFEFWRSGPTASWVINDVGRGLERQARCAVQCPADEKVANGLGPLHVRFTAVGHSATGLAVQTVEVCSGSKAFRLWKWLRTRCLSGEYVAHLTSNF